MITITVNAVDDQAVVTAGTTGTGNEDATAITGTLTATDGEGLDDTTYFSIANGDQAANGSASIDATSGDWSYTPNANFNGTDTFTVTITDDLGGSSSQVITITVNAVNDTPVQVTAGVITSVLEDSNNSRTIALWSTVPVYSVGGGSDEASQILSYTITSIPTFISLFKADGTTVVTTNTTLSAADFAALTYTTIANANGSSSIDFTVSDSGSSTSPGSNTLTAESVSIAVTAVDDDLDGASNTFETGKDNNNDGIDDSQQANVATFASANAVSSLSIANPTLERISDPTGGSAEANIQLVFDQVTTDSNATQGLQLGLRNIDPTVVVNSTSELFSFTLTPSVGTDGDVANLDIDAFTKRNLERFKANIQEVELYFQESDPNDPDWNALYKTKRGLNNSLDYYLFNFDPITGLGGILVDRNNNGRVDGAKLYLKDGSLGDFDEVVNGQIVDPVGFGSISSTPTLKVTDDNKGLKVDGLSGTGLWINLNVEAFNSLTQSNLEIYDLSSGNSYGAIGATLGSGPTGSQTIFLAAGTTINFRYSDGAGQINSNPALSISTTATGFSLALDADLNGTYTDLILDISSSNAVSSPTNQAIARKQLTSSDTILDLTSIPATGIRLTLDISTDCSLQNRFGFVKIDPLTGTTYQVAGVSQSDGAAFRSAVLDSFIDPYQQNAGKKHGHDQSRQSINWDLTSTEAGYYAPVMITQGGEVLTFGASTASDGRQHTRLIGINTFGFEDLLAGQGSDWDFNDTKIMVNVVD